jgi:hypothetical protein
MADATGYVWSSAASSPTGVYTKSTTVIGNNSNNSYKGIAYAPGRNLYMIMYWQYVIGYVSSWATNTYTSSDGITWTKVNSTFPYMPDSATEWLKSLVYHSASDKFYAVGIFNSIWSSTDGTSWIKVRGNHWLNVSFNWLSTNAANGMPIGINSNWYNDAAGGGCFRYFSNSARYVFGTNGGKYVSAISSDITNVATWSKLTNPTPNALIDMAYSPTLNRYVVFNGLSVDYSSDLITWANSTAGFTYAEAGISRVIWGNGRFVGVGCPQNNSSSITASVAAVTSLDGITWTRIAVPGTARLDGNYWKYLVDIVYGNSIYVAVGGMNINNPPGLTNGAPIATSSDGVNWTARQEGTYTNNYSYWQDPTGAYIHPNSLLGVVFTNSTFIAVGNYGLIVTSTDNGVTWTNRSGTTAISEYAYARPSFIGIAVGNNIIVAVGYKAGPASGNNIPVIITSIDNGTTWVRRQLAVGLATGGKLTNILFDGTKFVAVGNYGLIITSTDGINWTVVSDSSTLHTISILPDGRLMVTGDGGTILTSIDGATWSPLADTAKKTILPLGVIGASAVAISSAHVTIVASTPITVIRS